MASLEVVSSLRHLYLQEDILLIREVITYSTYGFSFFL